MNAFSGAPAPRQHATACFSVFAAAEPSVMPRVLDVFAKRALVPSQWHSTVCGHRGEDLHIDIQVTGLEPDAIDALAACLRRIVGVDTVLTSEKGYALSA